MNMVEPANSRRALHRDELLIDADLVAALVRCDVPDCAGMPVSAVESAGSTNVIYRLGDALSVRLPRQVGGGEDILKEARLTPLLSEALPVAVPEVVAVGEPGFGYPERWSVTRWLTGGHPTRAVPGRADGEGRRRLAEDLAAVVRALRCLEVPADVSDDLRSDRGGALSDLDAEVRSAIDLCRTIDGLDLDLDLDRAEAVWEQSLLLPGADEAGHDQWFHGDLVAENLLVSEGRLSGVLDFGAVAVGDPTIDLHGAWEILDAPARAAFAHALGVGEAEWLRGRAWALGIALNALSYYWTTMPGRRDDRIAMARNVLDSDAASTGVVMDVRDCDRTQAGQDARD